ncbi:MAG: DUF2442 domain-containing protein [Blastocatellia bacterium]
MGVIKAGQWTYTDEEFDRMYEEAKRRSEREELIEVRALAARYDKASNRIILDLSNGATFIFPCDRVEGLSGAAPKDLARVELWGEGTALHWEDIDVDFSVSGIVAGVFGTKAWMRKLANAGARSGSKAKRRPALANVKTDLKHTESQIDKMASRKRQKRAA